MVVSRWVELVLLYVVTPVTLAWAAERLRTGSMLLAAEHGAYGITAFTAGLGTFLYLGARPRGAPEPQ